MKKTLLSLIYFVLGMAVAAAQNYQTVNSERTVLFEDTNHVVHALRIDSVQLDGSDSILYPFSNIRVVGESSGMDCYSPYAPSWIGSHIVIQTDGVNLFFNQNQDTIKIKTQAQQGDSWLFYQDPHLEVIATVSSIDTLSFLGQVDSVKTISLQAYSQYQSQPVIHAINAMPLLLSKEYGLLSVHNFYILTDIYQEEAADSLEFFTIIGMNQPEIGMQNLTWFQVHDFQVGDIIHKRGEDHSYYSIYDEWFLAERYLERYNYADSIVYRIERENLILHHEPPAPTEYFLDTIYHTIYSNPEFDKLSFEPAIDIGAASSPWVQLNSDISSKSRIMAECYFFETSDCWWLSYDVGTCYGTTYYLKGLGGEYIDCPLNMYSRVRELLYYRKGDDEWGEPIDFSVGINTAKQANSLTISPNPAQNIINISVNIATQVNHQIKLEILNAQGKLVKEQLIQNSDFTIDISHMDKGLYFVRMGSFVQKLLIE